MAYIPPHKRHSGSADKPTPLPASFSRHFSQSLTLGREKTPSNQGRGEIVYAAQSICRWWISGGRIDPDGLRLEPFSSCEILERERGSKPMVLAISGDPPPVASGEDPPPWRAISERIECDLRAALISARGELASENEEIKLSFVARLGKVLFYGESSSCLDSLKKAATAEVDSRGLVHKSFYANVPNQHIEKLKPVDLLKLGFDFDFEKEYYLVKVLDKCRRGSTITCQCIVIEGGGLEIHRIELNKVRHLVVDISCLSKDLDVRLMLCTKRILKTLNDEEEGSINKLITEAVMDSDVKGGLRWPLGKDSVDNRFKIIGVVHIKCIAFRSQNIQLKIKYADRFCHKTLDGEVDNEVKLKLTGISEPLRDENMETTPLLVIQDAVKLIWNHFLGYGCSSTET